MNVIENYNHKNIEDCDKFLAKGILTLLGDPKLRSHYSSQSIKRAKDFSIATWEEKHNQIIQSII